MPLIWLVTGAGSGFGEQLVYSILERGDKVIATARNAKERLQKHAAAGAAVLELDVTASQTELDQIVEKAITIYGGLDVLVNNAAYIQGGIFEELGDDQILAVFKTNLLGPINLTRAVLPHFRAKKNGTLLFMSSVGAWYGAIGATAYCSTKGALESAVECLREEVTPLGIRVCTLVPGYYKTAIFSKEKIKFADSHIADYSEMMKGCRAGIEQADGNQPGDPKKAMDRVVDAVRAEGRAKGKTLPARLPLGDIGTGSIRNKCKQCLEICDEWEDFTKDTVRDEAAT